jgi:hypothetical protein
MDKATLRSVVLETLTRTPQTHFHAIENEVRRQVDEFERHDVLLLQEIVWDLLVQGVLAPGKNSLNLHLPFVHVTQFGMQCLQEGVRQLQDPDAYMQRLESTTGRTMDDGVRRHVHEALLVFLAGSPSAAVVLLSRAVETLFDRLADGLLSSAPEDEDVWAELAETPRASRRRAEAVIEALQWVERSIQRDLRIQPTLNGLLAAMQLSRQEDGAARWPDVSRDRVQALFLLFPEGCAVAYHLIDMLNEHDEN